MKSAVKKSAVKKIGKHNGLRYQAGVAEVEISAILLAAMILAWALVDLAQPGYQQQRLQQISEDIVWLVSAQRNNEDFADGAVSVGVNAFTIEPYQHLLDELWLQTEVKNAPVPGIVIQRLQQGNNIAPWSSGCENSGRDLIEADLSELLKALPNGQLPAAWVVTLCLEQTPGLASRWFDTGGRGEKTFPLLIARSILVERDGF